MRKLLIKITTIATMLTLICSLVACTYRKDGSVCRDVKYKVSYNDTVVDGTMTLYKTFAPKTYEHILGLIKDGFYKDSQVVFDKTGTYLVLGTLDMANGSYTNKSYSGDSVEGEFTNNGFSSQLNVEAGAMILLREPDNDKGNFSKYNTGKCSIAIALTNSPSGLNNSSYCVFGKIDATSLEKLQTMKNDTFKNADGYSTKYYIGDRDEKTNKLNYENSFVYYEKDGECFFKDNGVYVNIEDLDEENDSESIEKFKDNHEKIHSANYIDILTLPTSQITIGSFKVK